MHFLADVSFDVDGLIATNTSAGRNAVAHLPAAAEPGGLSGAPLHPESVRVIAQLRAELGEAVPIIGVGGIVSADGARETLNAGANLVQLYTGFAYRGADLLAEILNGLGTPA